MKPNPKTPLYEAAELSGLLEASQQLGMEISQFIDFIQFHYPSERTTATLAAAFFLHQLPSIFRNDLQMMQQLEAIVEKFSQS